MSHWQHWLKNKNTVGIPGLEVIKLFPLRGKLLQVRAIIIIIKKNIQKANINKVSLQQT